MDKFIGVPWKLYGKDYSGCDCIGLAYLFLKDYYGILLDQFARTDFSLSKPGLNQFIRDHALYKNLTKVDDVQEKDIVVCLTRGVPAHVGVAINKRQMLHVQIGQTSVIEDMRHSTLRNKINGYYRIHV